MTRVLSPLALLVAAAIAQGQQSGSAKPDSEPFGVSVRIAYGFSDGFDTDHGTGHVQGPEIAVQLPIGTFLHRQVLLEPSFFGGGRLRHGGDDDSDIYRLTAFLHTTFARGIGARAGVGFAVSGKARGGGFESTSDVIFDFGLEIPFAYKRLQKYQPYADVHATLSPTDRLTGYFAGVGVKL